MDSRAMSLEIETGPNRDEFDDVVSSGQVAMDRDGPPMAAAAVPTSQAQATHVAAQAAPASKPQVSGKFKLMKLMKKKK